MELFNVIITILKVAPEPGCLLAGTLYEVSARPAWPRSRWPEPGRPGPGARSVSRYGREGLVPFP